MRTLGFCLLLLTLAGCATLEKHPNPLTAEDLVARAKSGATAKAIIDEIFYTDTLIALNAAEIVRLHDAGVPDEVLDYLQTRQLEELRWRARAFNYLFRPGLNRGFCPRPWC